MKTEWHGDKHCEGCHYYRCICTGWMGCNYILLTGKKRPCPPGKDCTVKKEKRRRRKKVKQ